MNQFEPLNGYEISGCAVRSWNIISFWGQRWHNPDPLDVRDTRIYYYYPDEPEEDRWAYREIGQTRGIRGCGINFPEDRWVFLTDDGEVYVAGGGVDNFEDPIVTKPFSFFSNVKRVQPGYAYAVGSGHKVYRRTVPGEWRSISTDLLQNTQQNKLDENGFKDIDGFTDSDIYACGGKGDLWHFDGNLWKRIDLNLTDHLGPIACSSDGLVYIISGHTILAGRDQKWNTIEQNLTASTFESIVEFNNKMIISTQNELYEISQGQILPASLGKMPSMKSSSFLSSGDGVLVVAGGKCAYMFDGNSWSVIFE